jgi:hypothetical protein
MITNKHTPYGVGLNQMRSNEAVRSALLEILGNGEAAPHFYRKGEAPKGTRKKALVIFVGTDDEKRTPLYTLGGGKDDTVQEALNLGSGEIEDDVYTVTGKLESIATALKPAYKDKPQKTAVRITLVTPDNSRLILQSGLGTVFIGKLLVLLAAGASRGKIEIGTSIGIRVERGTKEAKVVFPSLGYETAAGWTGVNIRDTAWDTDQFYGRSEHERDTIALELIQTIEAAFTGDNSGDYEYNPQEG